MSEAVLVAKSPQWTRAERRLYANATVRVLGETDRAGRLLVEITSGELAGLRRWMSEEEMRRTDAENDCIEVAHER